MTKRRFVPSFVGAVLVVAGCNSGALVKAQEQFADQACACKDIECLKKVQVEQSAWAQKNGESGLGSEADLTKVNAANKRLADCAAKIVAASPH